MSGVGVEDEPRMGASGRAPPGSGALRVLVAFSPDYACYGEVLSRGLRASRPRAQVRHVPLREAREAARHLRPHLVVTDRTVAAPGAAKARISAEPAEPSTMRLGGVVRTVVNPSFDDLLAFVHEVERAAGG